MRPRSCSTLAGALLLVPAAVEASESTPRASEVRYAGFASIEVAISDESDRALVHDLATRIDDHGGTRVLAVVHRDDLPRLREHGLAFNVRQWELDAALARAAEPAPIPLRWGPFFSAFATNEEMDSFASDLAERHADVDWTDYGTSIEGRPLRALMMGDGRQPTVAVIGTQHAREWISPMVVACLADAFSRPDKEPAIESALARLDFVFVPIVNPDGYAYTHEVDRLWRKNRRGGYGVDLNRNWDVHWGVGTAGQGPGSESFPGEGPFSEPETDALRTMLADRELVGFFDYHSPIALVLYPFAFTSDDSPQEQREHDWADAMATAITAVHGVPHGIAKPGVGNPSGGLAQDWALDDRGSLAWTVELRGGDGGGGFVIDSAEIGPACDENLAGFLEGVTRIADEFGREPTGADETGAGGDETSDDGGGEGTTTGGAEGAGTHGASASATATDASDGSGTPTRGGSDSASTAATDDTSEGCTCRSGPTSPVGWAWSCLLLLTLSRSRRAAP